MNLRVPSGVLGPSASCASTIYTQSVLLRSSGSTVMVGSRLTNSGRFKFVELAEITTVAVADREGDPKSLHRTSI